MKMDLMPPCKNPETAILEQIDGMTLEELLADIPYQDPTPELLQKYMHYVNIGQTFYKIWLPFSFSRTIDKINPKDNKASQKTQIR